MGYEESLRNVSLDADATIGIRTGVPGMPGSLEPNYGKQYRFVKITGDHQAGLTKAGERAIGVLQNKPQWVGAAATVGIRGISNVIVETLPVAAGDAVSSGAGGGAVKAGEGAAVNGYAIQTASQAGEMIAVKLVD